MNVRSSKTTAISARFYLGIIASVSLILAVIGGIFFQYYLDESAAAFGESFRLQNVDSIEAGDVFELSSRLEATKKSGVIDCIYGKTNNSVFYQYGAGDCHGGIASRRIEVKSRGRENFSVAFEIRLPFKVQSAFFGFLLLNILVALIAAAWVRAHEQLKIAAQRDLTQLARQVAHDIRSPLGALDIVLKDAELLDPDRQSLANSAIARIKKIADDLLQRSKTPSMVTESFESTDINAATSELLEEKRSVLGTKYVILFDSAERGSTVQIPKSDFQRVLSNLINNAVEAMPEGGRILISAKTSGSAIEVIVQDQGKGIPPEILEKIGQEGVTSGKAGTTSGSGLGLAHAFKVMRDCGGEIRIICPSELGTIIKLILPIGG